MKNETILCIATRTWDSLWRESQQIMSRMAKQNRVIYFEPGRDVRESLLTAMWRNWTNFFGLRPRTIGENITLIPSPPLIPIGRRYLPAAILNFTTPLVVRINTRILIRHIRKTVNVFHVINPVLWLYSPYHTDLVGKFSEKISCYHNYDEFASFIYNHRIKDLIQSYDNDLSKRANLVFATSPSQAARREVYNPRTYFIPNGVDFDLFNRNVKHPSTPPADIFNIPRPIIGFAGWLGYHIDIDLLLHIGRTFPDYSLVFVGPNDLPAGSKRSQLESLPNAYFLGNKERDSLPDYLQAFDVALMPYLLDGHMRTAYPLKLHEYLAAGRAIVAVEMEALLPYRNVIWMCSTPDEMIEAVRTAIHDYSPQAIESRVQTARENTWENRVECMYQVIDTFLAEAGWHNEENPRITRLVPDTSVIPIEADRDCPLVSIVIVTWNRKAEIMETIHSIHTQTYQNIEIVVVDNASTDGTVESLQHNHPEIKVIPLKENLGASAGRNPGITAAQGEIIFLLDSDASLGKDTIQNVVKKFQSRPDIGVIACKVVNASTKELDRIAGWIYSERDKLDQDREFLSFSFSECGCALRKEVFAKAGLFWDALFFGGEGEELSLRIWDAGYAILYSPESVIYHRVSPNERVAGCQRQYYKLRNMLYIYLVRYPWWMLPIYIPIKLAVAIVRAFRSRCLKMTLHAILDVMKKISYLLKQRNPIKGQTGLDYMRLQREHGPWRWDLISWFKYKT